jgi:diamine N-acetyltransferase
MMPVQLRATTPADLDYVLRLERDDDNRRFIGQWTDAEHEAAIRGDLGRRHRMIELGGAPAGYVITYDGRDVSPSLYVKRILVADKERGTGRAAMRAVLDDAFGDARVMFAWLLVREWNGRAQSVYRKLGFARYEPEGEEAAALLRYAEAPGPESFRMRLDASAWRG